MIYINVTNTRTTGSKTGIQRVVNELSRRLRCRGGYSLLSYEEGSLRIVDSSQSHDTPFQGASDAGKLLNLESIAPGDILLDPDASWGDPYDIGNIYKTFKRRGAIIVKFHHDAVPILYPDFADQTTAFRYSENFMHSTIHADYWICVSKTVESDLKKLFALLSLAPPQTFVAELGSDMPADSQKPYAVEGLCKEIIKEKYILAVGTIEPRKNYDLILDVYDEYISSGADTSALLVLVGKSGWNNESTIKRIKSHSLWNSKVFWLNSVNDTELDLLYRNASVCLCLSHYEGFGLPAIEALSRGIQVICTAGSSLEEVSRGFAHAVAFDPKLIAQKVSSIISKTGHIDTSRFKVPTWDIAADRLHCILSKITAELESNPPPEQAVYISVRPAALRQSILSVIANMDFIKKFLILTSDEAKADILASIEDLKVDYTLLSESEIGVSTLPEDHLERNTLLRSILYSRDEVEANFIAFDDDYAVMEKVEIDNFYSEGKHKAYYYCEAEEEWLGALPNPTSFDRGIWRTRDYLTRAGFDAKLYNSHQPQIINKKLASHILETSCRENLDEWSSYYNIAKHLKPNMFITNLYQTAGWPANFESWLPTKPPENILFYNDLDPQCGVDAFDAIIKYKTEISNAFRIQSYRREYDPKIFVTSDAAKFNVAHISCYIDSILHIPIYSTSPLNGIKMTFLDKVVEYQESDIPNFLHIPLSQHEVPYQFQLEIECSLQDQDHPLRAELSIHILDFCLPSC